jgi:hypothetical protein
MNPRLCIKLPFSNKNILLAMQHICCWHGKCKDLKAHFQQRYTNMMEGTPGQHALDVFSEEKLERCRLGGGDGWCMS